MREGYITVTGGRIWYKVLGEDRKAIPLLALHGGPGATHDYMEPLEALTNERPVVFYDQLGSGNSDRPKDDSLWTVERFTEEVKEIRKALKLNKVHVLGQSWGTMLAVSYIFNFDPEGVISLILSSPALSAKRFTEDTRSYLSGLSEKDQNIIRQSESRNKFDSKEYQDAMINFYKLHLCRLDKWPGCLNRTFEKMGNAVYNHMWGPSEFTVTGTLKDFDVTQRLKEISIPTLFTCGRYDEASPAATEYYHKILPGSEIAILEDASHCHFIEKADEYNEIIREFMQRAERKSKQE